MNAMLSSSDPLAGDAASSAPADAAVFSRVLRERLTARFGADRSPARPSWFVLDRYATTDVRAMALRLRRRAGDRRRALLLTEDRAVMAAAVLACLAGGPDLVMPNTLPLPQAPEPDGPAAGADLIITDSAVADSGGRSGASVFGLPVITADGPDPESLEPIDSFPMAPDFDPDGPRLFFFTGGSTGRPRLWAKSFRNIAGESLHHVEVFGFSGVDRLLSTVPPYHIYGFLFTVMGPLLSGAALIDGVPVFPQEIRRRMAEARPTVFVSVPAHYRALSGGDLPAHPRLAFSSAGRLEPADGDAFYRHTGTGVTEIYGSTETGGIARRNRGVGETALTPFSVVNWRVGINERLEVESPFVSAGTERDADGFFATGDRVEPAGEGFRLLGRADGIVKVGGKRVDLEEIRDALLGLPGVEDAVVVSLPGEGGREHAICALVQMEREPTALRAALAGRLPAHALPRRIRTVASMPMTPAGKYDRVLIQELLRGPAPE